MKFQENHSIIFNNNIAKKLYGFARKKKLSFIFFQLPLSNKKYLIFSLSDVKKEKINNLRNFSNSHPVFIFTPYEENQKTSYFESDIIINFDQQKIFYNQQKKKAVALADELAKIFSQTTTEYNFENYHRKASKPSTSKKTFIQQVQKIKETIEEQDDLQKIVLSKIRFNPSQVDPISFFISLANNYPNTLTYFVSSTKVGTWVGATPELLISKDEKNIFQTLALAGTYYFSQPPTSKTITNQPIWSEKEIVEQAYVSRFIVDAFKTLRLREYLEIGPKNFLIGNLCHLATIFKVNTNKYYGDTLPYDILPLIHPTPAICGYPRKIAIKFISEIEKHKRDYYTGYLGPWGEPEVKHCSKIDLYVNLRCSQLVKGGYLLYAGVGVTKDSNPGKEWLESEAKTNLLERFLR